MLIQTLCALRACFKNLLKTAHGAEEAHLTERNGLSSAQVWIHVERSAILRLKLMLMPTMRTPRARKTRLRQWSRGGAPLSKISRLAIVMMVAACSAPPPKTHSSEPATGGNNSGGTLTGGALSENTGGVDSATSSGGASSSEAHHLLEAHHRRGAPQDGGLSSGGAATGGSTPEGTGGSPGDGGLPPRVEVPAQGVSWASIRTSTFLAARPVEHGWRPLARGRRP